jgi:hypothetical protein
MTTNREWVVFSTCVADGGVIMVECVRTGAFGIVRNPTRDEWAAAFHAPSAPYRWTGGDSRVTEVREGGISAPHYVTRGGD